MRRFANRNKYSSKKCIVTADGTLFEVEELKRYGQTAEGIKFDSKMEAKYYIYLLMLQHQGQIKQIDMQPAYQLEEGPRSIIYKADFLVTWKDGRQEVIDVKGVQTKDFRMKAKMFRNRNPHMPLVLVTLKGGQWLTKEVK